MNSIFVTDHLRTMVLPVPNVPVVPAREYLTDSRYGAMRNLKVFNLCRSYRYQTLGYYVSLLAVARGHKPCPTVATVEDMRSPAISRIIAEDLNSLIERSLRRLTSDTFQLSIYFGRNMARQYEQLSSRIFRLFPVPLARVQFRRDADGWRLLGVKPLALSDLPESHWTFATEAAAAFFARREGSQRVRTPSQYELAILQDPAEKLPPSNRLALKRFMLAARRARFGVELITREDFGRLAEFDALFIRETTSVKHHTYRFARRAAAEGLVVIDDADSIARCSNKVYLAELLQRVGVPVPRTLIVHRDNRAEVEKRLGWPCILKQPDSSFSRGVVKAGNADQCAALLNEAFEHSDLVIAQEFVPTAHDWRIGVLDGAPLFACKYHMVARHWQIARASGARTQFGKVEALPLDEVPAGVVNTAVAAANAIGRGFYGVDVKEFEDRVLIVEVNDNPNVDAGYEDKILRRELYDRVIRVIRERIEAARGIGRAAR